MPAPSPPDRRRSRIGRLIETDRSTEARAELLAEAAEPAVKTRAELARHLGVTRQTVGRWARVLECGAALDDVLYALDRRDPAEGEEAARG